MQPARTHGRQLSRDVTLAVAPPPQPDASPALFGCFDPGSCRSACYSVCIEAHAVLASCTTALAKFILSPLLLAVTTCCVCPAAVCASCTTCHFPCNPAACSSAEAATTSKQTVVIRQYRAGHKLSSLSHYRRICNAVALSSYLAGWLVPSHGSAPACRLPAPTPGLSPLALGSRRLAAPPATLQLLLAVVGLLLLLPPARPWPCAVRSRRAPGRLRLSRRLCLLPLLLVLKPRRLVSLHRLSWLWHCPRLLQHWGRLGRGSWVASSRGDGHHLADSWMGHGCPLLSRAPACRLSSSGSRCPVARLASCLCCFCLPLTLLACSTHLQHVLQKQLAWRLVLVVVFPPVAEGIQALPQPVQATSQPNACSWVCRWCCRCRCWCRLAAPGPAEAGWRSPGVASLVCHKVGRRPVAVPAPGPAVLIIAAWAAASAAAAWRSSSMASQASNSGGATLQQ